jgi:nucleotide-binding universal stress UspA family protein
LLVATDGGDNAAHALALAAAYARRRGLDVEVVSVVEPLADLPMPLPHRDELEVARARDISDRVREHVLDVVGPVDWPIHVRRGRPAPAICTTARARKARMVVLGVESDRSDNAIAVELLHLAEKPVLVAHGGTLPRSAVVGIDFRESSLRTAEEVAHLLGPDGTIHLVHVKSALDFPAANVWDWSQCYECAVDGAFERVEETLSALGVAALHHHCRPGERDPAEELMSAARELDADLLGIGSDGYICNGRVVVGRVARKILAESETPVLASPVATSMEGPFAGLEETDRDPVEVPSS